MSTSFSFGLIWQIFLLFAVYPLPAPDGFTPPGWSTTCWLVWRFMLFTTSSLLAIFAYVSRESIFYTADVSGYINDSLKYVSLVLTSLLVICESFANRRCHINIWRILARISQSGQYAQIQRQFDRRFTVRFYACLAIIFGVEVRIVTALLAINDQQWLMYWCIDALPLMICRLMCLLHIYYIELVASFYHRLQQELEEIVTFSVYSMYVKLDRSVIVKRLEAVSDIYGLLFEATANVNAIFAWSQAFNFNQMFLENTCNLHWIYKDFAYNFPILVFCFVPMLICFLQLLRAADGCVAKAKSLVPLVYQLKCVDEEMALSRLILQFSNQLSHEPISFGVNNLYTIDYGLLRTMLAAIVTYMIIFIQMTPK